ncbi:hypothetical protein WA588_006059, partial [Blastocystis sp. NMH]
MDEDIETDQSPSPQMDHETYSIDEIKGVKNNTEEEAKKPRRKKEPIERFTTEQLIQEKGIPELMIKGRRLYLKDKVSILKKSDAVMQMYRSWASNDYGLIKFEDFLTRSLAMSTKPEIRHMLDNYRDMEMQKYVSAESSEPENALPESVPTVAVVTSGEGEKELDLDEMPAPSSILTPSSIPAPSSPPTPSSNSTPTPSQTENTDHSSTPASLTRLSDVRNTP